MIQVDGSHHRWLGNRRSPFALLLAVDDATGTVVDAGFSEREDARSPFLLAEGLVRCRGIPLALYTDRHRVFRHTPGAVATGTATQFSRAVDELGVQMVPAQSPQAKGRVERTAGTFQDRLVTEASPGWWRPPSREPTPCCRSFCRDSTTSSTFRRRRVPKPVPSTADWMAPTNLTRLFRFRDDRRVPQASVTPTCNVVM